MPSNLHANFGDGKERNKARVKTYKGEEATSC